MSPNCSELGHFTLFELLFCKGRQRNVQRFIMHVNSYGSSHYIFCLATFSSTLPTKPATGFQFSCACPGRSHYLSGTSISLVSCKHFLYLFSRKGHCCDMCYLLFSQPMTSLIGSGRPDGRVEKDITKSTFEFLNRVAV